MNRALIGPIAALLVALIKQVLGLEIEPAAMETTLDVILAVVIAIGFWLNPKREG